MERKSKKSIILGTTVLLLVMLTLLGLTYAYYRTRVIGNTNDKSLGIVSKKLEIVYNDGNEIVEATDIKPGDKFVKTFTIENTGDDTIFYNVILEDVLNTFVRNDWSYVLTKNGSVISSGKINKGQKQNILNKVDIASKSIDTYSLEVTYANLTDVDQSIDMGKTFSAKVNIEETLVDVTYIDSDQIEIVTNEFITENEILTKANKSTINIKNLSERETQYITLRLDDIEINDVLKNQNFKWAIYENGELLTTYNFNYIDFDEVILLSNIELAPKEEKNYEIYLYLIGNDNNMLGKNFSAKIMVDNHITRFNYEYTDLLATNLTSGKYLNVKTGVIDESHTTESVSDFIEVDRNKVLFTKEVETLGPYFFVVFYDENKSFVSGVVVKNTFVEKVYDINGEQYYGKIIDFPENAKYFVFSAGTKYVQTDKFYKVLYVDKNLIREHNTMLEYENGTFLNDIDVVNFGDSIFGGNPAPNDISSYLVSYTGATTYNVAVSGTRMSKHPVNLYDAFSMYKLADAITSGDYSLQQAQIDSANSGTVDNLILTHFDTLKSIDFNNIEIITIGFGTNDFTSNTLISTNDELSIASFIGSARYSINKIRDTYPNIKIVLLTPIYRFWKETSNDVNTRTNTSGKYLVDYVNALKELKEEYNSNVYIFDGYNELDINYQNKYVYFDLNDGTHPHTNGRKYYAYKLGKYLENINNN